MENHFIKPPESYGRDLNILKHYKVAAATYLHKQTGQPLDLCRSFVEQETAKGGPMEIVDPEVLCLTRDSNGVKRKEIITLNEYLRDIEENRRIVAPTLTTYLHQDDKVSMTSLFIEENIAKRSKAKKEMFVAEQRGNKWLANYKNNEQSSKKTSNNSLSGGHASKGTILYNKSTHPSLTSTCRTATSYANANNEKFIAGNRHYWKVDLVKADILNIINHAPLDEISKTIEQFGLAIPTPEQVMDVINYSLGLYIDHTIGKQLDTTSTLETVRTLVYNLNDVERAAYVYVGDLYHLAKYNEDFIKQMLGEFITKKTEPVDDPDKWVGAMDNDTFAFASLICSKETVGKTINDLKEESPEKYGVLASTAKHIFEVLDKYSPLIKSFWITNCLPLSVANIRNSVRRAVVTSDTDSTIFTTQFWTEFYVGQVDFSETSNNISYAITYLAAQTVTHILATVSSGFGVNKKHLNKLAMKSEFTFPVFALTSIAKHYYSLISSCEGNVYSKMKTEIKGVQLKDSNAPPHIMEKFNNTLITIMTQLMEGKKIEILKIQKQVADIELSIIDDIRKGGSSYLKSGQIQGKDSYANPQVSPYMQYLLWNEVFGPKYGMAPELPYRVTKVSVKLNSKTKIKEWLDSLEDREIAERMENWMITNKKLNITSLMLPAEVVSVTGIPEEIIKAMNIRKIVHLTTAPFYLMLESLGVFMINDNLTRLISDDTLYSCPK